MRSPRAVLAVLIAGLTVVTSAHAQYPDRPLTMVVPFPPGGVADTVARPIAEALARELKQPVVIENRGGAGGALGIGQVARAPADGYTLLMSLSSISILPEADKILDRKPQYQLSQFRPIARITADPTVLVVRADAPWRTVEEFVADAKRKPTAYNYGSSGNYGTMQVPMEMLKGAAGFRMTHIPYTGAGPAVAALLGGQVDVLASGPSSVVQHIRAGKLALSPIGEISPWHPCRRSPASRRRGFNVRFVQWSGIFVGAETPPAAVQRLRRRCEKLPPILLFNRPCSGQAVRSNTSMHLTSLSIGRRTCKRWRPL